MLKELRLNMIERAVFLLILLAPLKFFTFKISSVSLSISRIIFLILLPLAIIRVLKNLSHNRPIYLNAIYFNRYSILLFFYAFIMYFFSLSFIDSQNFGQRIHLSSLSFFESFFLLPILFFILIPSTKSQLKIMKKVFIWMKYFVYFGLLQLALDLVGISLSYESFGEPALENRAYLLGFDILRISSFFGEPRDLAALIIPIFVAESIVKNIKFNILDYLKIIILGLLTVSSSFIASAIAALVAFGLFSSKNFRVFSLSFVILSFSSFLIFANSIQDYVISLFPRYEIVFEILSSDFIASLAEPSPEIVAQISDVSFFSYLFNFEFINLNGFLGNGLGSAHFAIKNIALTYFQIENNEILFGSRWIFYTFLLEIGIIGSFLIIKKIFFIINSSKKYFEPENLNINYYSILFFISCLFGSTYFFLYLPLYLSILVKSERDQIKKSFN